MSEILKFFKGKRGDIISRLPSGKVALVNKKSTISPSEGEKWLCRIDFEKPTFAVVTPIERVIKKTKITEVYDEYQCGHKVLKWTTEESVEVPESVTPQKEIRVYRVPRLCDECLRRKQETCEHKNIETTVTPLWIAVRCKDCDKCLFEMEFSRSLLDMSKEELDAIEKNIDSRALKEFRNYRKYIEEYKEKIEEAKELEEQLKLTLAEMARVLGAKDVKIEGGKVKAWFGKYANIVTGTIGKPSGKSYETDIEPWYEEVEMTPEVERLFRKYLSLKEKLNSVNSWLTDHRPSF